MCTPKSGDVTPLMKNYASVTVVGRIDSPFAESYETHMPIFVLRGPRVPLKDSWAKLKYFE
jgi:hypothetical protein